VSESRHTFEEHFAAVEFSTVERLRDLGWWSGRSDGDWRARCVPPGSAPAEERRILAGLVNAARFGETPPTNGAGGG